MAYPFTTQELLEPLMQMKRPRRWLNTKFFGDRLKHAVRDIRLDIKRGVRRLAPFVSARSESKVIERIGFKSGEVRIPYIKEKLPIDPVVLLDRLPGEVATSGITIQDRAAKLAIDDLIELMDMVERTIEWMSAQALTTGQVEVIGDDLDYIIDYLYLTSHKIILSGTSLWTNAASDPFTFLRDLQRTCIQDSGITPRDVVMGSGAVTAFLNNPNVRSGLNLWYLQNGSVVVDAPDDEGVRFLGTVQGFNLWEYIEFYVDPITGTERPMIPANTVILGSVNARTTTHFGVILDLDAEESEVITQAQVDYFPKTWREKDPSIGWIQLQSSPLPAVEQPDAFAFAVVI
jgi:hypothetical protein